MDAGRFLGSRCGIVLSSLLLLGAAAGLAAPTAVGKGTGVATSAEQLVADALRAEVDGNSARRRVQLSAAIDAAPDYEPARWHSGQVRTNGEWLPVDKAQQVAAADPKRAEYQRLRAAGGNSLAGQLALARWCRKNNFDEEARFHWATVLSHDPNHDEAQRALGARWYRGRLMTTAEIELAKSQLRKTKKAAKEFAPQIARWERLLAAGDVKSRDQALDEIRKLQDPHAIPAVEELTLGTQLTTHKRFDRCMQMSLALVAALHEMPGQAATNSLLRHAVLSPVGDVRTAATAALKQRSPHDYVPQLLASLSMPIESSFRVATGSDGSVHYWHSLYREGPDSNWSSESRRSAMQHDLQGPLFLTIDDKVRNERSDIRFGAANNPAVAAEMASVAAENRERFAGAALTAEQQIERMNRGIASANRMIYPVLTSTTGEDFGENPRAWWDWWNRYNEYSTDDEPLVHEQSYADSTHRYYRPPRERTVTVSPPTRPARIVRIMGTGGSPGNHLNTSCCFAAGTLVWTRTGLEAIESLEIGDLVLAQSVETGELAYQPILGRTERPASECLRLSVGEESVFAALGHPLWVAGVGWRMAKELADGAILHGVNGPVRIDAVAKADEAEAYNLIVADFNTYFVGKSGVLVHDNTPREPTTAVVPGLVAK